MNIFALIKKDHDEARAIMDQIIQTEAAEPRVALFEKLKVAILAHAKSEEKTFYEAMKENDKEWGEEVPHFTKEHKEAEKLLNEISATDPTSSQWWEKFGEVRQALTHHMEEEEKEVFPDLKKEIPSDESAELGQEMEAIEDKKKEQLQHAA